MRFLYVMDPLETMLPDKDTTFAFMRAAQKLGHINLHCLLSDLSAHDGRACATARRATVDASPPHATYGPTEQVCLSEVDAILIRKDPPFDTNYMHATQMIELARRDTFIMNDPQALRDADEKLYALRFPDWIPRTCVTADRAKIRAFVDACGGTAVIKPIGRAGGYGVMKLSVGDINTQAILEMLTEDGRQSVMIQQYLPEVREGDKRVLLLDGKLLGAVLRVPQKDDLRANIHVGGQVKACDLTDKEMDLVASVGPRLRESGLYFVGLDVIGQRMTEINVTSPTGIQELGRLTNTTPEDEVIRWLERKAKNFGARC